jgi:hypothetical protein
MTRIQNRIIGPLAAAAAVAALAPTAVAAQSSGDPNERTATELGQAVGEPGGPASAATALYERTPTELGQTVSQSATPSAESSGFDWGDAAIGAGAVTALGLITFGGIAITSRRTGVGRGPGDPAVSS